MVVVERISGRSYETEILPVTREDYKSITKARFWFNWREEKEYDVFKIRIKETNEILGLISLKNHKRESRTEIKLIAVSNENTGKNKKYEHIAGNLITFACIRALDFYGNWASVSLIPKTKLIQHYIEKYHMHPTGKHLFLDIVGIMKLINKYNHD
ncbi:MAG: N-acetyltransferase [Bacteroidota bacterium]